MVRFVIDIYTPQKGRKLLLSRRNKKQTLATGHGWRGFPKALQYLEGKSLVPHQRIGEGGVGMTTLAYCGAEADGRVMHQMMYMGEHIRPQLSELIERVHNTGAKVSGQLSHCGNFTKNQEFQGRRPLGPSAGVSMIGLVKGLPWAGAMTKTDIAERVQVFAKAAGFMKSVGFDAIEIHFGHGYGISQFISPRTNKRTDEYGGSLENRMRFGLEVLAAVRTTVGDDFPLLAKISMSDGVKGGVSYEESVEISAMLDNAGIDGIICSGGTSSMNPMLLFRGDSIAKGMIKHEKNWLMKFGLKLLGPKMFKEYPYEETYFIEQAKKIVERVSCKVIYIGGVCTNESIEKVMAAGFDFIQIGRGLIHDPDFVNNAQAKPDYKNGCNHCNECASLIEAPGGIRCVLKD